MVAVSDIKAKESGDIRLETKFTSIGADAARSPKNEILPASHDINDFDPNPLPKDPETTMSRLDALIDDF